MEVERGGFDIIRGSSVVVDDRHAVARVEQLLGFDKVGTVCVHHDEQRARLGGDERVVAGDKGVLVFRKSRKLTEQRLCDVVLHVDDDLRLFAALARDAADAGRCADHIHVRVRVAHDEDLACVGNELAEGVGHHAGFDLRALFGGLGLAAVEFKVKAVAHDDLVAAARERHFDREHGVLIERFVVIHVLAHADRERCGDAVLSDDASHRVKHGEFTLKQLLILLLGRDEHVAVTIEFAQQAVRILEPCADLFVDGGEHRAARRLAAGFHQLLVVVDHDDRDDGAAALVLLAQRVLLGHVRPVRCGKKALSAAAGGGMAQIAEHAEVAPAHHHRFGALAFTLEQPVCRKIGENIVDAVVKDILAHAGELHEAVIAP